MNFNTKPRTAQLLTIVFGVLCLGVGLALVATSAQAAETPSNNTTDSPNGTRIQQGVYLQDRSYSNATGTATVTLHVEQYTTVTLADGAVSDQGEIPRTTEVLEPGTHTVSLDVEPGKHGTVAVTVSTDETLYLVPIEQPKTGDQMFQGSPGWGTVRIAGAGSAFGVLLALGLKAYRRRSGGHKEVHQRA